MSFQETELPIILHNGHSYAVDDNYVIGDRFMAFSDRGHNTIGEKIYNCDMICGAGNPHVNFVWNTGWYYPDVPMGVFHIVATNNPALTSAGVSRLLIEQSKKRYYILNNKQDV